MSATKSAPARRRFLALLSGAAAAPVAAALPTIAATTAPAEPVATEAPELLAIGERLPDIAARIQIARARLDEAVAAYERLKPAVPPEIIAGMEGRRDQVEAERGLDGKPVRHEADAQGYCYWDLYSSRKVRAYIILHGISGRTKEGRRLHRIARLAEKFEKDRKAATDASGYRDADLALLGLRIEMQDDFAIAALAFKPRTMKGLGIYATIAAIGTGPATREGDPIAACEAVAVAMADAFVAINGGGTQ